MAAPTYFNSSWPAVPLAIGRFQFDNGGPQLNALHVSVHQVTAPGSGSAVTVADTYVTATSMIVLTPATPGGTQAGYNITSITPGTGFQVTFGSSDTTLYNYVIIG
jgi:hypothetical protein